MRTDVNAFVGSYPFRRVPGTAPEAAARGDGPAGRSTTPGSPICRASSGAIPTAGNAWLLELARAPSPPPVPAVHPGLAELARHVGAAADAGAPPRSGRTPRSTASIPPGPAMRALAAACGEADSRSRSRCGSRTAASGTRTISARASGRRGPRADPERSARPPAGHPCRPAVRRGGAFRLHAERGGAHLVGHLLDLGTAGGSPADAARHGRRRPVRARHRPAAAAAGERGRQARPAGPRRGDRAAIESGNARALGR